MVDLQERTKAANKNLLLRRIQCGTFTLLSSIILFTSVPTATVATTSQQDLDSEIDSRNAQVDQVQKDLNKTSSDVIKGMQAMRSTLDSLNVKTSAVVAIGMGQTTTGTSVDLPVTIVSRSLPVTSLQADVILPTGITMGSFTAGPALTSAGKSIATAANTAGFRFIVSGLNQTPIGDGILGTLQLTLDSTVKPGIYSIGIVNPVAAKADGTRQMLSVMSGTIVVVIQ